MTAPGRGPSTCASARSARSRCELRRDVAFYRDLVGLPVVDEFHGSYGEDGTIFGLPGTETHLEIVRTQPPGPSIDVFDQLG